MLRMCVPRRKTQRRCFSQFVLLLLVQRPCHCQHFLWAGCRHSQSIWGSVCAIAYLVTLHLLLFLSHVLTASLTYLACLNPTRQGIVFCPKFFLEHFHLSNSISEHKKLLKMGSYCKYPIFQMMPSFRQTQSTASSPSQPLFPLGPSVAGSPWVSSVVCPVCFAFLSHVHSPSAGFRCCT